MKVLDESTILTAVEYLRGEEFTRKLNCKNLSNELKFQTHELLQSDNEKVFNHVKELSAEALDAILYYFGSRGGILLPFSGGRDSTLLAELTLRSFHSRQILLVTCLTGMYHPVAKDNGREQATEIFRRHHNENARHTYLDISPNVGDFVISDAMKSREILGYPGLCTDCKMLIEASLATLAEAFDFKHVAFGYAAYQAEQQWTEQTKAFRSVMEAFHHRAHPEVKVCSPLQFVLRLPVDAILLLAGLGISVDEQKHESKCAAGGTNPIRIDEGKLSSFLQNRIYALPDSTKLQAKWRLQDHATPDRSYIEYVQVLKKSEFFMRGAYPQ